MKLEVGAVYLTREGGGARVKSRKGLPEHPYDVLHTPVADAPKFLLWHREDGTVGTGIAKIDGVNEGDPVKLGKKYDLIRLVQKAE